MGSSEEHAPPKPKQPIVIGVDPRLDVIRSIPDKKAEALYKKVYDVAVAGAKRIDQAVNAVLDKYELPNDLLLLKDMGYELMINTEPPKLDNSPRKTEVVLYKKVEMVEVG